MKFFIFAGMAFFAIVFFSCREDLVKFEDLEKDNGSLYLNTFPEGAEIFLKDTKTNLKTPEQFEELEPGEYVFTLKLDGYSDTTIVMNVESGKKKTFKIYLKKVR